MPKVKNAGEPVTGSKSEEKVRINRASEKASKKEDAQATLGLPAGQQEVVVEIGRIYTVLCEATRTTVAKAIEMGEHLAGLRKQVGHGHWGRFVKAHLPFNERTAERYMHLYNHRETLTSKTDTLSELFLSQAYALVSKRKAATTASEDEQATSSDNDQSRQRGKDEILTGIQRGLVDGLEKLEQGLLEEFERDVFEFKSHWLSEHRQGQQQEVVG